MVSIIAYILLYHSTLADDSVRVGDIGELPVILLQQETIIDHPVGCQAGEKVGYQGREY